MVSIRIWTDRYRIITTRKRKLLSITDLVESLKNNQGPTSAGDFVVELADRLTARMAETIESIDDHIALIEDDIVDTRSSGLRHELSVIRRQAIMLRRYLAPQREALTRIHTERISWFNDVDRIRMREVTDKLIRYIEDLDSIRDRASVIQEELANRLSEQMNARMYVLSLVAALFLPLGFLTGLLGINVGGIPGSEYSGAFFIFVFILTAVVVLQIFIFKKNKWL
jgi:zinc transporter